MFGYCGQHSQTESIPLSHFYPKELLSTFKLCHLSPKSTHCWNKHCTVLQFSFMKSTKLWCMQQVSTLYQANKETHYIQLPVQKCIHSCIQPKSMWKLTLLRLQFLLFSQWSFWVCSKWIHCCMQMKLPTIYSLLFRSPSLLCISGFGSLCLTGLCADVCIIVVCRWFQITLFDWFVCRRVYHCCLSVVSDHSVWLVCVQTCVSLLCISGFSSLCLTGLCADMCIIVVYQWFQLTLTGLCADTGGCQSGAAANPVIT